MSHDFKVGDVVRVEWPDGTITGNVVEVLVPGEGQLPGIVVDHDRNTNDQFQYEISDGVFGQEKGKWFEINEVFTPIQIFKE